MLSQYLSKSINTYMQAATRVLRYIKNAPSLGLFFSTDSNLKFIGFTDSDWGACPTFRRSTTSFNVFLSTNLISRKYKKQQVILRSYTKTN